MTTEEREKLLKKIRACYARANTDRNDNEHERAIALRQANKLVEQHAVSMAELDADELGEMGQTNCRVGMVIWKQQTYFALGKLYGCEVLWNTRGTMYVIGRASYRSVVEDMAKYVITSIERQAKASSKGDKSYLNGFRKWAVQGVRANIEEILEARKQGVADAPCGTALVLVDHFKKQLEDSSAYLNANYNVKKGRAAKMPKGGYEGYAAGRGIGLADQIGGGSKRAGGGGGGLLK